jgi:SPP1 family predicted phage head-tail adaptor
MPRYSTHKKLFKKVDVGSMNNRISIQTRIIKAPTTDTNYSMQFSDFVPTAKLWACMESVDGVTIFDGANIERAISHVFYTRYVTGFTFLNWIEYQNNYYRIYKVDDLQNEHKFYKIYAGISGDKAKPVDWA